MLQFGHSGFIDHEESAAGSLSARRAPSVRRDQASTKDEAAN
jgi:hypothetical protein